MSLPGPQAGLLTSLRFLSVTLLSIGQTRLTLLGNEVEVFKLQVVRIFVLAQALLVCAVLGVLLTLFLAALVWWEQRLVVMGVFAGTFLIAAGLFYRALMQTLEQAEPAFNATLAELHEDIKQLKAAVDHGTNAD